MIDLKVEGESQVLGITPTHQFWSHDRTNAEQLTKSAPQPLYWWTIADYPIGDCYAVSFPGEDDPIVECIESGGTRVDDAVEWTNRRFTGFAFSCSWHRFRKNKQNISGANSTFLPAYISKLADLFEEGPHVLRVDASAEQINPFTGEGLRKITRFHFYFFSVAGMVHLRSNEDPRAVETEVRWTVSSEDEIQLFTLISQLKHLGIISPD